MADLDVTDWPEFQAFAMRLGKTLHEGHPHGWYEFTMCVRGQADSHVEIDFLELIEVDAPR